MPKPTNTQELTARYLAAGAGFKPEEQMQALCNSIAHIAKSLDFGRIETFMETILDDLQLSLESATVLEKLADDKAPF